MSVEEELAHAKSIYTYFSTPQTSSRNSARLQLETPYRVVRPGGVLCPEIRTVS